MMGEKACKRATRLASEALERKLSPGEWLRMRLHMAMCASCRHCEQEIRLIHDILTRIRRHPDGLAVELPEQDRRRIRDALRRIAGET